MTKTTTPEQRFIAGLDKAIEFHRGNAKDKYNVGNAVMCALMEVRNAFSVAYGLEREVPSTDARNTSEPDFTPTGMPERNE
jgi:hypothetical protein